MRKLIDIVKIIIGFAAGFYAVMQACRLQTLSQTGDLWESGGGASEQAFAFGGTIGSIVGMVLGGIICVTLIGSAFFGKRKKKAAAQDESPSDKRAKRAE